MDKNIREIKTASEVIKNSILLNLKRQKLGNYSVVMVFNDEERDYFFKVLAYNSLDHNYTVWSYRSDLDNLFWGHYNLSFKDAISLIFELCETYFDANLYLQNENEE